MIISIIAAIGRNNELGADNKLLWSLPADMKFFRDTTRGRTVIMGRKTFESIGRILPNRTNIIITRDNNYNFKGATVVHSLEEALQFAGLAQGREFEENQDEVEVFIIGGAQIYKQGLDKAHKLYITHVDEIFPLADTFFPVIDQTIWNKTKSVVLTHDALNEFDMEFVEYVKI